jgi:hypothetical protein
MGKIEVEFEKSDWVPIKVIVIKNNRSIGTVEDLREGMGIYFNPELYISNMMEEKESGDEYNKRN